MSIVRTIGTWLLTVATAVCLAYALFGGGFWICTTPQATQTIGGAFSGWEDSTFPEEDMATLAEAVRSFSIEGTSSEELFDAILAVVQEENPDLATALKAGSLSDAGLSAQDFGGMGLATLQERYSMPQDALSHLQDCTPIFTTGRISTGVVGGFGVVGAVALCLLAGRKRAGLACMAASLLVVAVLVGLGAWAVLDFDGLFAWMHSLFFVQGTWTFSSDSLLIQLFPEAFWAAMAGLWVISSLALAAIMLLAGKLLRL